MTTSITVADLISRARGGGGVSAIFPVSTQAGVVQAVTWFELVKAFSLNSKEDDLPNKMALVRDCTEIVSHTTVLPAMTTYDGINNDGSKILSSLDAIEAMIEN